MPNTPAASLPSLAWHVCSALSHSVNHTERDRRSLGRACGGSLREGSEKPFAFHSHPPESFSHLIDFTEFCFPLRSIRTWRSAGLWEARPGGAACPGGTAGATDTLTRGAFALKCGFSQPELFLSWRQGRFFQQKAGGVMGVGRGGWRRGQPGLSPLLAHGGKRLSHRLHVTSTLSCQRDSFPGERSPCQCLCQGPCRAQVDFGTVCSASSVLPPHGVGWLRCPPKAAESPAETFKGGLSTGEELLPGFLVPSCWLAPVLVFTSCSCSSQMSPGMFCIPRGCLSILPTATLPQEGL